MANFLTAPTNLSDLYPIMMNSRDKNPQNQNAEYINYNSDIGKKIEFIKNNTQPLFHINQKCIRHYKKKKSQYVTITNILVHNFNGCIDYFYRYHYNNNQCNGYAFQFELSEILTSQPNINSIQTASEKKYLLNNYKNKNNKNNNNNNKNHNSCLLCLHG